MVSNLFDQNAPAIAVVESMYGEMWATDVVAMSGYYIRSNRQWVVQLSPWQNLL
ncbi:PPE domain-containing protein [Mycobacterium uberis]|uniref:PPE domain-containing protein n=1 Tax=Mycobacterium uberis TaxID=2162698 RepID=UPI001FB339C3|nr:PPE domain-containing protein [Mycobacterium uberis]